MWCPSGSRIAATVTQKRSLLKSSLHLVLSNFIHSSEKKHDKNTPTQNRPKQISCMSFQSRYSNWSFNSSFRDVGRGQPAARNVRTSIAYESTSKRNTCRSESDEDRPALTIPSDATPHQRFAPRPPYLYEWTPGTKGVVAGGRGASRAQPDPLIPKGKKGGQKPVGGGGKKNKKIYRAE